MKHIILIGFKHVGKSAVGSALAKHLNKPFLDLDTQIEKQYAAQHHQSLSCREIMAQHGEHFFRAEEESALTNLLQSPEAVIALGGGTPLTKNNQQCIQPHHIILIEADPKQVWERIQTKGLPAYFSTEEEPFTQFQQLWQTRQKIYQTLTNDVITNNTSIEQAVAQLLALLSNCR